MRTGSWLLALACFAAPALAHAQGAPSVGGGAEPPTLAPTGAEQSAATSAWAHAAVRPFISSDVDLGWLYARPRIAFGYGRPHWLWFGVETATAVTSAYGSQYAGLRAAFPFLDARVGARYTLGFSHYPLPVQDSYNRFDIDRVNGTANRYVSLEAELTASVPIPTGALYAVGTAYVFPSVSPDNDFFEESLHVVVRGNSLFRGRVGYLIALGSTGSIRVGPVAEFLAVPGRDAWFVRAGVVASLVLTSTLEIVASFVPTVWGPDSLGLVDGDFAQLGLRWLWATGVGPGWRALLGRAP